MKLIRAIFPVGEGILCIAVILECMGLMVLITYFMSQKLDFEEHEKGFFGSKFKVIFCANIM